VAKEVLEVIIKSTVKGKGFSDAEKGVENFGNASEKTTTKSKKMGTALKAVEGAAIAAGVAFLKSIPDLVDYGLEVERAEKALIGYAGSSVEAERATELVTDAVDGSISKLEAMRTASRFLSMGLAENAEEAAKFTDIAVTLGASMGKGPTQAVEDFSLMLANTSIPRLDTFGVSAAEVRARMNELQSETEGLDRQTAFLNATMEIAGDKMIALEDAGFQATSSIDRMKAITQDAKAGLATFFADGLVPIIDGFFAVRDALEEHNNELVISTDNYEDYAKVTGAAADAAKVLGTRTNILTEEQYNLAKAVEYGDDLVTGWESALGDAKEATDALTESNTSLSVSFSELDQQRLAREALKEINKLYEDGLISEQEYLEVARELAGEGFLGLSESAIEANIKLSDLNRDLQDGKITLQEYRDEIANLKREIDLLPIEKHVNIVLGVSGGGNVPGYSVPPSLIPASNSAQTAYTTQTPSGYTGPVSRGTTPNSVVTKFVPSSNIRHGGGQVSAGSPYLVRPSDEVFVPDRSGTVLPSNSGAGMTFVYSPMISLANRDEVERVIMPMIEKGIRDQSMVRAS